MRGRGTDPPHFKGYIIPCKTYEVLRICLFSKRMVHCWSSGMQRVPIGFCGGGRRLSPLSLIFQKQRYGQLIFGPGITAGLKGRRPDEGGVFGEIRRLSSGGLSVCQRLPHGFSATSRIRRWEALEAKQRVRCWGRVPLWKAEIARVFGQRLCNARTAGGYATNGPQRVIQRWDANMALR